MRWRCPEGQAGTVTAELAMGVPAVLLVLAACLGGLRLGLERMRAEDAAAVAARVLARQEPAGAAAVAAAAAGAALTGTARRGGLVCADVRSAVVLLTVSVPVTATGCALAPVEP